MAKGGMPEKGLRSPVRLGVGPMRPRPTGVGMKHGGHLKKATHMKAGGFHHADERAQKGHTKGKDVKMASGGHVGSHPHRRGDGAAAKGHTRCRVV